MINSGWDNRFLEMAELVASWSKDPSTKVGAVIVDEDRRVLSLGYNGFPLGLSDDKRLDNREIKYKMIVHAECNALLFCSEPPVGATIYTYPFMPCPKCAGMIIQTGITRVVSYKSNNERWSEEFALSRNMFKEAGIELLEYEI
ncbi:MAG: dCMP deaminase family protein [SAR202 cluster bacterium]|nr:dCMP deaminase family protein [SAR202 cluster bacterium]|tara:strand:- start:3170 stop:3601 length:432 start_codon:yes stop_codon:yes gene_type:complete